MKRMPIAIIGLIMLLAFMQGAYCQAAGGEGNAAQITVMGEGTVTVPADTVTISLGVETNDANFSSARAENDQKLNRTLTALRNLGVSSKEVLPGVSSSASSAQSSVRVCNTVNNTTVCQERTSSDSNLIGNSVLIRIPASDQSKVDKIIETARNTGATAVIVGYGLNDDSSEVARARKAAVENARSSAVEMASAAGVRLGKVLSISDYPGAESYADESEMAFTSTKQGTVDVSAYVVVTYEIY